MVLDRYEVSYQVEHHAPAERARLAGESLLRVPLPKGVAGNPRNCEVMIDQSRAIDNRRFRRLLGRLSAALLRDTKVKLKLLAEL